MTVTCQCGTPMTRKGTGAWCSHCDEPHRTSMDTCQRCATVKKADGIGPKTAVGWAR